MLLRDVKKHFQADSITREEMFLSGCVVFVMLFRESSSIMHNSRAIHWTETGTERQHGCIKGIIHPEMIFHTHASSAVS